MCAGVGMLPEAYDEHMKILLDEVPPRETKVIRAIIEEQLGPMDKIFFSFSDKAMAAASIGQVHKANLLDGTDVVVKI